MKNFYPLTIITIICIITAIYCVSIQYNHILSNPGEIAYVSVGKSIFNGKGYINDFFIEKGLETQCPPMLPLLYGFISRLTGYKNFAYFYAIPFIFYVLSLLFTYVFIKEFSNINSINIYLLLTLFLTNGMIMKYFTDCGTEGFFYALSILCLITLNKFLNTKKTAYFIYTILLAAISTYSRASGISLCLAITIVMYVHFKFRWYTLLSLFSLIPILSFFYYQWLFFGVTNYYLQNESFFSHWNVQYLKFNIGELIFYIPSESIFHLYGDKNNEWLLSRLHTPILQLTKGVQLDFMGLLSILFWIPVLMRFIHYIKSKNYTLPFYLGIFILMFTFHCCASACADPRLFFQVLPIMILFFVEFVTSINNKYIRQFLLFFFIILYLGLNLHGIIQYNQDMKRYSRKNFPVKEIDACLVDEKIGKSDIIKARLHLFKLCFNKGYDILNEEGLDKLPGKTVIIYTDNIDKYSKLKQVNLLQQLQFKDNTYLLYAKIKKN